MYHCASAYLEKNPNSNYSILCLFCRPAFSSQLRTAAQGWQPNQKTWHLNQKTCQSAKILVSSKLWWVHWLLFASSQRMSFSVMVCVGRWGSTLEVSVVFTISLYVPCKHKGNFPLPPRGPSSGLELRLRFLFARWTLWGIAEGNNSTCCLVPSCWCSPPFGQRLLTRPHVMWLISQLTSIFVYVGGYKHIAIHYLRPTGLGMVPHCLFALIVWT